MYKVCKASAPLPRVEGWDGPEGYLGLGEGGGIPWGGGRWPGDWPIYNTIIQHLWNQMVFLLLWIPMNEYYFNLYISVKQILPG